MNSKAKSKAKYPDFVIRHFAPLVTRSGALLTLSLCTSFAFAMSWMDRSIDYQIARNSLVSLFLSVELGHESSDDFAAARTDQAALIEDSMKEMQTPVIHLIGLVLPKYSPPKHLTPALDVLVGSERKQFGDREAMDRSKEILEKAARLWSLDNTTPDSDYSVWTYRSDHRRDLAKDMLSTFHRSMERFNDQPDAASAEKVCMQSRFAARAMLISWIDYSPATRNVISKEFADQLSKLHDRMLKVAASLPSAEKVKLGHYAENISVRADMFLKLNEGGIPAGRERLMVALASGAKR